MTKNLDYYMSLNYKMEIEKGEDTETFIVSFPELKGCITSGRTIEEAYEMALDAKKQWILACLEDGIYIPEPAKEKYSGNFRLRVPKNLHKRLAYNAQSEGVSMNSYCMSILSKYA